MTVLEREREDERMERKMPNEKKIGKEGKKNLIQSLRL